MLDRKTLQRLGAWKGYRLKDVIWPEGERGTVELHLEPTCKVMICSGCGQRGMLAHETTVRRVRDLPLFEYRVVLVVPRRRVWCERCGGPRLEQLSWLSRYQRVTDRLADACSRPTPSNRDWQS